MVYAERWRSLLRKVRSDSLVVFGAPLEIALFLTRERDSKKKKLV